MQQNNSSSSVSNATANTTSNNVSPPSKTAMGRAAIRAGVVGLGYYGTFHTEKYARLPGCKLVAVADRDAGKVARVAEEHDLKAFTNYRDLIGLVDAVSVVTPTGAHFGVAKDFIEAGTHVLIEKAITETVTEAQELVRLAKQHGVVFQVGHLERFNPAFLALPQHLRSPTYIETHRQTRFQKRGDDVSVVLDLMIHDIDLVHALIPGPVTKIAAKGVSVYSPTPDLVNAVLYFDNGAVANLTASRASIEPERRLHLFQERAYSCLDMQQKSLTTQEQSEDGHIHTDVFHFDSQTEKSDILQTEIASFLEAVKMESEPVVTGQDGLRALDTAIRISSAIAMNHGSSAPLPVHKSLRFDTGFITHDHHPETRKPFFSRTTLVNTTVNIANSIAATVRPRAKAGRASGETA